MCAMHWLHLLISYPIPFTTDLIDTCQHMLVNKVTTVFHFEHTGYDCDCVFTIVHHGTMGNTQHSSTSTVWAVSITSRSHTGHTGYVYHISPWEPQAMVWCPTIPCCVCYGQHPWVIGLEFNTETNPQTLHDYVGSLRNPHQEFGEVFQQHYTHCPPHRSSCSICHIIP